MKNIIIISVILTSAAAAPVYFLDEEHQDYHGIPLSAKSSHIQTSQIIDHGNALVHTPVIQSIVPLTHSKTTITKSNQLVNHGGSAVLHPIHAYEVMPVHELYHIPSKTTITKSNQIVNHGGTAVLHTPVVHAPVVHAPVIHAPVVHAPIVHAPIVYHSSPVVAVKTGDSAITHHSSTVHETVPIVKSLPVYAIHH